MSEHLAAAAQAMNVPEALVQRSAEARAKATGSPVDEVLAAWAGGKSPAAAAPAPVPTSAPTASVSEPQQEVPTTALPEPAPAPAPQPAASPAAAPVAAAVAVIEAVQEEPVEAAPLGERMRRSARVGAMVGLGMSVFILLLASQWLLPRATTIDIDGTVGAALDIVPGWLIAGMAIISAAVGAAVAGAGRMVTGWFGPGLQLTNRTWGTVVLGSVAGLVVGAVIAAVVVGSGTPNDLLEGVATIPVLGSMVWTLAGWTAGGWLIGLLVQAFGVPRGVESDEAEESSGVKRRLATAYSLPAVAGVAVLVLVLPVAYVFISYPGWAPVTAVFVSASILGFAGLSASRPGMKVSGGEFLVAVAGVIVVVTVILAVLAIQGGGHGEETHGEGEAAAAVLIA